MVTSLLRNIVSSSSIGKVPVTGEDLAKHGVEGLLDSRRPNVPAAEVEFDNGYESLQRIVDFGDRKEHFRVAHEAIIRKTGQQGPFAFPQGLPEHILGYPFQHAARFQDEGG